MIIYKPISQKDPLYPMAHVQLKSVRPTSLHVPPFSHIVGIVSHIDAVTMRIKVLFTQRYSRAALKMSNFFYTSRLW